MIVSKVYNGTSYSKLKPPNFRGLLAKNIDLDFEGERTNDVLIWKINATLRMQEVGGNSVFKVLEAKSIFALTIKDGVSINELHEVVKEAVRKLKECPNGSKADRRELLSDISPPPIEAVVGDLIEIVNSFETKQ
jgi:hypothetical protein